MALFRFTVRRLMVAVAVVAVNTTMVRAYLLPESRGPVNYEMMVTAVHPMANLIAGAIVLGARRSAARRRFIVGFVVCGGIAMATFLAWIVLSYHTFVHFWRPILMPVAAALRMWPTIRWPRLWTFLLYASDMAILLIPQLLLAVIGGWLTSKLGGLSGARVPVALNSPATE